MRLINADALMDRFRIVAQSGGAVTYHVSDICAAIEDEVYEESVDAVEVVRCGKCRKRAKGEYGMCHILCRQTHEDDFCSYGERRTDNGSN